VGRQQRFSWLRVGQLVTVALGFSQSFPKRPSRAHLPERIDKGCGKTGQALMDEVRPFSPTMKLSSVAGRGEAKSVEFHALSTSLALRWAFQRKSFPAAVDLSNLALAIRKRASPSPATNLPL